MHETQSGFDVFGLSILVSPGQENHQLSPSLFEIHPVTRSVVDSQLRDTLTNWLDITWVSSGQSFDPSLDASSGLKVTQAIERRRLFGELRSSEHCSRAATYCQARAATARRLGFHRSYCIAMAMRRRSPWPSRRSTMEADQRFLASLSFAFYLVDDSKPAITNDRQPGSGCRS